MEIESILKKYNFLNSVRKCQNKCLAVIKSNLMFKCKELAKEEKQELDTGHLCCKWCLNSWKPGQFSMTLQPQKHPKGRTRSLLNKDVTLLNKFQQKFIQKIQHQSSVNVLIFKCHICERSTQAQLKKNIAVPQAEEVSIEQNLKPNKKKKKKKKDLYAGLNPAVLQNCVKSVGNQLNKSSSPANYSAKKHKADKKLTLQKQIRLHQELMYVPQPRAKPKEKSLLSTFLENM